MTKNMTIMTIMSMTPMVTWLIVGLTPISETKTIGNIITIAYIIVPRITGISWVRTDE